MRTKRFFVLSLLITLAVLPVRVMAGDVYVIANSSLVLAEEDIKEVFVGDKQIANGIRVKPMDNTSLQKDFLEKVLKMEAAKYSNIWTKKGFREGLSPPATKSNDGEVVSTVKSTVGAVGYVSRVPEDVKVIRKY